jgi:trans-aconitate 2-methyltransferase
MADWSPEAYLRFADERSRPARDLLIQVGLVNPQLVYDLGCGPGNSTGLLAGAYPDAVVIGVDNSPAMLAKARVALPSCRFEEADLAEWQPEASADLLFSNATFQWVRGHGDVLCRLAAGLKSGAVLAMQVPDNLSEPSHRLMAAVAEAGPWAAKVTAAAGHRADLLTPPGYYDLLKPSFSRLDIWHTIYNHPLKGVQGIVDFLSSTGLRPYLDPLTADEAEAFLAEYKRRLQQAYPAQRDGTVLLRFPRFFLVGQRT